MNLSDVLKDMRSGGGYSLAECTKIHVKLKPEDSDLCLLSLGDMIM